jgi:hypothetical protein
MPRKRKAARQFRRAAGLTREQQADLIIEMACGGGGCDWTAEELGIYQRYCESWPNLAAGRAEWAEFERENKEHKETEKLRRQFNEEQKRATV